MSEKDEENKSKIIAAYDRSVSKWLRDMQVRITRKPATICAVNDIDESIMKQARKHINATQSSINKFESSAQLLWTTINPVLQVIRLSDSERFAKMFNPQLVKDFRIINELLKTSCDIKEISKPLDDIFYDIACFFFDENSFNNGIYVLDYINKDENPEVIGLRAVPIIGVAKEKREKSFTLDNKTRIGYGIGHQVGDDLKWAEIELYGIKLPVYIQMHALDRLVERTKPLHKIKSDVFTTVCLSASRPVVIEFESNILLEVRHGDDKIGYFVCMVKDNSVLITTFLFLTMDGTPEGEAFWKKLKVSRRDKEYLGLNVLSPFITSDMHGDNEIMQILKEVKCDHLLKMDTDVKQSTTGMAHEVVQYLSGNRRIAQILGV